MNKLCALITVPVLAITSVLLLFLLLDSRPVGATPEENDAIPAVRSPIAPFTVSGTVTCGATGPIADVKVFVWNRDQGTGYLGDTTDASGIYSVTLQGGNYDLNFNPPYGSGCASHTFKGITGPSDRTHSLAVRGAAAACQTN